MSKNKSKRQKIRFIGYTIPTTPNQFVPIGENAFGGSYLANSKVKVDIQKRIAILKNAVDQAKSYLPKNEDDVLNVFLAPEFFFHGVHGPYIYKKPSKDPVIYLKKQLVKHFKKKDYPNWTFICGTAVTTIVKNPEQVFDANSTIVRNKVVKCLSDQWRAAYGPLKNVLWNMLQDFIYDCHAYPCCEVRNRSVILSNPTITVPKKHQPTKVMTTEKYYESNEDFLLFDVNENPVITEQMANYPVIDISAGDDKLTDFDKYAIFEQCGMDKYFGVEICLDHSDTRLRQNIDNQLSVGDQIHVHLIPSCGMAIVGSSVAADRNGFVFNCDGQYALNKQSYGQGVLMGVDCLYANYHYDKDYGGHTQLARVLTPALGGDPNTGSNATFQTLDENLISVFPVNAPPDLDLDNYYAGGSGAIHIYGLDEPFCIC